MTVRVGFAGVGVALCVCVAFVACETDDDFIPFGHAAGAGGDAGDDAGGRGGVPGTGGTDAGRGGVAGEGGWGGVNGGTGGMGQAGETVTGGGGAGDGGTAGKGAAGEGGTAGENAAGGGGAGGDAPLCDGLDVPEPTQVPSCAASTGNDCAACLKQRCCVSWQRCYGEEPRRICGYGPSDLPLGQYDCVRSCYQMANDGIASFGEVLEGCVEECVQGCESTSGATIELLDCTIQGADGEPSGGDDCRDVCFPQLE